MRSAWIGWAEARLLATNVVSARRWHLLRFRLATFGVYEPRRWSGQRVLAHRWWQVNPRVVWLLFRRMAAYSRWLVEMRAATRGGQPGWWEQQAGPEGYTRLRGWIEAENAPPDEG
jgi:hypothetical protein